MEDIVLNRVLPISAITSGTLSVSKLYVVARMPTIAEGQKSAVMQARDARREDLTHQFYFRKRGDGDYPKQTLTGMRKFFDLHNLQAGDRIMIYLVQEELKLFGNVIRPGVYSIDFERG